jgi:nitric oxide reductase large subunit
MPNFTTQQKLHYALRLAVTMCFIGHGAFGIITKPIWCHYFAVFGIGHDTAYRLMPLLGSFDILMGIGMLIYPLRVIDPDLSFKFKNKDHSLLHLFTTSEPREEKMVNVNSLVSSAGRNTINHCI